MQGYAVIWGSDDKIYGLVEGSWEALGLTRVESVAFGRNGRLYKVNRGSYQVF